MKYNTEREKLIIPEYGRHVQKMVYTLQVLKTLKKRKNVLKQSLVLWDN